MSSSQALEPNLSATATLVASSDSLSPTAVVSGACSQSQSVESPQQEVWLIHVSWSSGKDWVFDLLQLVHHKLSECVVFAERVLVSWPGLSIMSLWTQPTDCLAVISIIIIIFNRPTSGSIDPRG